MVIEVEGSVDLATAPRLRENLVDAANRPARHLVVDLSRVDFIDSTGLGLLAALSKRIGARGGCLRLVVTTDPVRKPLRVTGLDKLFDIRTSVDAAVTEA